MIKLKLNRGAVAKSKKREPKSYLEQFFNYKLGSFAIGHIKSMADILSHLELKTRPRFSPVNLSKK